MTKNESFGIFPASGAGNLSSISKIIYFGAFLASGPEVFSKTTKDDDFGVLLPSRTEMSNIIKNDGLGSCLVPGWGI